MERLENVTQLTLVQAIEVRHDRIEFVDHVLFLVIFEAATFDAYCPYPLAKPMVWRSEASGKCDHTLRQLGLSRRVRDSEARESFLVCMTFDEPPAPPVAGDTGHDAKQVSLLRFCMLWV